MDRWAQEMAWRESPARLLQVIAAAARLGPGELSGVIETRKGALFFKIVDTQEFDRENTKESP